MTKYRGYYIDGVVFNSKSEIDEFVKKAIIDKARQFNRMLMCKRYTESQMIQISDEITIRERRLHDEFNMSYEDIENAIYA